MNATQVLRSSLLAIALCTAATPLFAAETQVSAASGDLAALVPNGNSVTFMAANGNYTIGSDTSFSGMFLYGGNVSINASANSPTVSMTGPISMTANRTLTFQGGLYDFSGSAKGAFNTSTWNDQRYVNESISLDDCVFTNITALTRLQNNGQSANRYVLQNGAGFYSGAGLQMAAYSVPAQGLTLSILSGSKARFTYVRTDGSTSGGASVNNHTLVVSGSGSSLSTSGNSDYNAIGGGRSGACLVVDDGANIDFSSADTFLGAQPESQSNSVTVANNATATFSHLYLGSWSAKTGYNRLSVLSGATVSATGITLNGDNADVTGNELIVSNATLNVAWIAAKPEKGTGTTIRFQGTNPKINISSTDGAAGQFINTTTLVFDVPLGGYATSPVVDAPVGSIWGDGTTTFVINGMEENVRKLTQKTVLWLMHSKTGAQFLSSGLPIDVSPAGEQPGRCVLCTKAHLSASEQALFPSAHSADLFLRIKPVLATMLYFR